MAKIKRLLEISFLAVATMVILIQVFSIFLSWRQNRLINKEIWKSSRASVTKINPRFPPRLLVEFENQGRWPVPKVQLLAVFTKDGLEIARAEREYGEVKPGEKRLILLHSVSLLNPDEMPKLPAKVKYRLLVFPGSRKPLPEISGEFEPE